MELVDYSNQIWWDTVLLMFVRSMYLCFDSSYFVIDLVHLHH